MNDEPKNEGEVTPKGAVEVNEEDLDQAAGGVLIGLLQPAANVSINVNKLENNLTGQKVAPTDVVAAGPGGGPQLDAAKKI